MSTTDNDSAKSGIQQTTTPGRLSLPLFSSTRDTSSRPGSQAESSASGSRWSAIDRQSRSPSAFRASSSMADSDTEKQTQSAPNNIRRRNQNRNSGGFLLEPTTHSSRLSRALLSHVDRNRKGKRKSEPFDITLPKRRNRQSSLDRESATRGSPLSTELRNDRDGKNETNSGLLPKTRDQLSSQDGLIGTPDSQRSTTPSVGLDTDPMQIVEMALKLSEGRRRQASGRGMVTGSASKNRVVSKTSSRQLRTPTKNLGQHMATSNMITSSPLANGSVATGTGDDVDESATLDDPSFAFSKRDRSVMENDTEISHGTAIRVEKAKAYIELAYEHRRLLSHLPPIRSPGNRLEANDIKTGSKGYNPLQYVRNRKLRIRERNPIDAEAEGWHDIEKVRAWVDAVVNSHTETKHDPLECVRLPPLSLREDDEDTFQGQSIHSSPKSPRHQTKLRRPRSDWVTHPGDLIADACWLEQGLNKTKICDRDNNRVYPADTTFKFSGWRNQTPVHIPEGLQQPTPSPEATSPRSANHPLSAAPQLPTFRSAHKNNKDMYRGRKPAKLQKSVGKERNSSRRRIQAVLDSSSDSDSSSDKSSTKSKDEGSSRGRKNFPKKFDLPEGDPFGQPISSIYNDSEMNGAPKSGDANPTRRESKRPSMDNSRLANYIKRNNHFKSSSQDRGRSRDGNKRRHLFNQSKDFRGEDKHGQSSTEEDSLISGSPVYHGLPSIAINLDAPLSRSPSPTKKSKSSLLRSLKDKSKHMDQEKIETTDFAKVHERSHSRNASVDADANRHSSNETSRGTSPFSRGKSPSTKPRQESLTREERSPSTVEYNTKQISRQSTRQMPLTPSDQPSKIRGVFKGGRIAELVGNEVSRVGDFIWKREVPPAYRHQMSGSDASFHTFEPSDTDEDSQNGHLYSQAARDGSVSTSKQTKINHVRPREVSKSGERPQFHNPNLPSFTSPFQRDRDRLEKSKELLTPRDPGDSDDHISRQAAQHRSRSKSPRLDRLAPPRLDTSAAEAAERKNSYGFGDAFNRSQSASRAFNDAINDQTGTTRSARRSNAGMPSQLRTSADRISQKETKSHVDARDLARIKAFLLISAVKAKNISAYYEQTPLVPFKASQGADMLEPASNSQIQLNQVRRRDTYVFTAHNLISQLGEQRTQINDQLRTFSDSTLVDLHKQIQAIEDQIENTFTPRVRTAADDAGELSVKLTTTSTQAVQNLQDVISEAFRLRRRGPFRWMKLLGYNLMEWAVVGLLWFIWAIVTVIRVFLGLFRLSGRVLQWLLWFN